jgi:transcriptional regulator with XRE-family HTH domain
MRFAHEFMDAETTVSRNFCQRLPVTEFRLNGLMAKKPPNYGFCKRVRDRRVELHMDRHELSDKSGLKYSTIADIENENSFSSRRIDALAQALRTTPEYLRSGVKTTEVISERVLSPREKGLVMAYRALTESSRVTLDGFIKTLPKKRSGKIPGVYDPIADRVANARTQGSG